MEVYKSEEDEFRNCLVPQHLECCSNQPFKEINGKLLRCCDLASFSLLCGQHRICTYYESEVTVVLLNCAFIFPYCGNAETENSQWLVWRK